MQSSGFNFIDLQISGAIILITIRLVADAANELYYGRQELETWRF